MLNSDATPLVVEYYGRRNQSIRLLAVIVRLTAKPRSTTPIFELSQLVTESDVEQKLVYPLLTSPTFIGLPAEWIRTKEYMTPTEIDKVAGKRRGYVPDYSVWIGGLPLLIVEAKAPDVVVEVGLREAQLYAGEINKRYPPGVNPIGFVLACNGEKFALSEWDSQTSAVIGKCDQLVPGAALHDIVRAAIGKDALTANLAKVEGNFIGRPAFPVSSFMGGQSKLNEQLGVNEFAHALFPTLTKYFAVNSDDTPDEIVDRAYVSSEEITTYEGVLETYLKDRTNKIGGNELLPVTTSRTAAPSITKEVQVFADNPSFFSRVQLVVGSVGAGKSTFVRRYFRRLMSQQARDKTRWAFINFNALPTAVSDEKLHEWVAQNFVQSFSALNNFDVDDLDEIEKLFAVELNKFERGPNKPLSTLDPVEFARKRAVLLESLAANPVELARSIARLFSGEKKLGIVCVFDNVDKRSRDQQLGIFQTAQWFKELTRSLVLVNLRDSTFEAHRDEPPLDAFANAINFYVRAPRFNQVIKKRLELVLEVLPNDLAPRQHYTLSSGYKISYPTSKLGEFLLSIYISLFDSRSVQIASCLEALVAKDVRRALGMFADVLVSPHIPANLLTGVALGSGFNRLPEYRVIRALMRGRYRYFNAQSQYVRNVLSLPPECARPSNFLIADILEYLIRHRKERIDFTQEGYATIGTLQMKMAQAGYDEEDTLIAVRQLVAWGLMEAESLSVSQLSTAEAVRVHASGFIHMRFLLQRSEYLLGISTDLKLFSRSVAEEIGAVWAGQTEIDDLSLHSKRRILKKIRDYVKFEYARRCRRHAFYEDVGWGGRSVVTALDRAVESLYTQPSRQQSPRMI